MQKVNPRQARQSVAVRPDESSRSLNNLLSRENMSAKTSVRLNDVFLKKNLFNLYLPRQGIKDSFLFTNATEFYFALLL